MSGELEEDLKRITAWLLEASCKVPPEYFHLPVAGGQESAYRERVYCYELYHQWRSRWSSPSYSLCGEVDKSGHPLIPSRKKPDFLVHVPGRMKNLLVMEVKPANARPGAFEKDLKTLTEFRGQLGGGENYFAAYLWIYGMSKDDWVQRRWKTRRARFAASDKVDPRCISVWVHEAGQRAESVSWEDLV